MACDIDLYTLGVWSGREDIAEQNSEIDIHEIDWIVENLSWFFTDISRIEPVAVSKAMTRLLANKNVMEKKLNDRKKERKERRSADADDIALTLR